MSGGGKKRDASD
ncbi:hypothetical protein E2320_002546, partial [Naja naja]